MVKDVGYELQGCWLNNKKDSPRRVTKNTVRLHRSCVFEEGTYTRVNN